MVRRALLVISFAIASLASAADAPQQNPFAAINLCETAGRRLHFELFKLQREVDQNPDLHNQAVRYIESALDLQLAAENEQRVNTLFSTMRMLHAAQEGNRWRILKDWLFDYVFSNQEQSIAASRQKLPYLLAPRDKCENHLLWIVHHLIKQQAHDLAQRLDKLPPHYRLTVVDFIRAKAPTDLVDQLRQVSPKFFNVSQKQRKSINEAWGIPVCRDLSLNLAPLARVEILNGDSIVCSDSIHGQIIYDDYADVSEKLHYDRPTRNGNPIPKPANDGNRFHGYRRLSYAQYINALARKRHESEQIEVDDIPFETADLHEPLIIADSCDWKERPQLPGPLWQLGMALMQNDARFKRVSSANRAELLHKLLQQSQDVDEKINLPAFLEQYRALDTTPIQDLPNKRTCLIL